MSGKTFSRRVSARPGLTSVFGTTIDRAHCEVVFHYNAIIPPGRSEFIMEARSGNGPWETFFIHPVRGAIFREPSDGMRTPVIMRAGFDATISSNERT